MNEKLEKTLEKILKSIYEILEQEYSEPESNVWEPRIGDPSGLRSPNESLGLYRYEREAVVALTRELDKRWPGQWHINAGFQFSMNRWENHPGMYVLASIDSWYTEDKTINYIDVDDGSAHNVR